MKILLVTILIPFIVTVPLFATNYHVAKTGNDGNSGVDLAHAWLTVQKCLSTAVASDICTIYAGTYTEAITFLTGITLNVNSGDTVTIDGTSNLNTVTFSSNNVTIDGSAGTLNISNGGSCPMSCSSATPAVELGSHSGITINSIHQNGSAAWGIQCSGCSSFTLTNSELKDDFSAGVNVTANSADIDIEGNTIHNVGGVGMLAIVADIESSLGTCTDGPPTSYCTLTGMAMGTYLDDDAAAPSGAITNVTIQNNEIYTANPSWIGFAGASEGIEMRFVWGGKVNNNNFHEIYNTALQTELGVRHISVTNNTSRHVAYGGGPGYVAPNTGSTCCVSENPYWIASCAYCLVSDNTGFDSIGPLFDIQQSHRTIVRRNIGYNLGGYDGGSGYLTPATHVQLGTNPGGTNNIFVHNTLWNVNTANPNSHDYGFLTTFDESSSFGGIFPCNSCVNSNVLKNNIFSESARTHDLYKLEQDDVTGDYNLWWNSGRSLSFQSGMGIGSAVSSYSFSSFKSTFSEETHSINSDPLFVNTGAANFALGPSSPAIDAGQFLTTISSSTGSGTSVTVADPRYFADPTKYNISTGDVIKTSAGQTATVTGVNYSTGVLTLNHSISWTNGDGVAYSYNGTKPDMGAIESSGVSQTKYKGFFVY